MSNMPRILIVDDDPRMCDSLEVLLGKERFEIQKRHKGMDALDALSKEDFDLVLLDLSLPDIKGSQVLHRIHRQFPETFVIVITGYASLDSAVDSLKKGACDYLRKPFEYEDLSRAVKHALDLKALESERKRAQEALRESEEKYKKLVENSLTGIFIQQDGKYVFVNDRFSQIHGAAPEEMLGDDYLALIHPDDRDAAAKRAAARLRGEVVPQHYELRRLKKDGTTVLCEMIVTRIEYGGRPAIMGNIVDITERKRAEEALARAKEAWENTFDAITDIVMLLDSEHRIIRVNRAAAEALHASKEALVGKTCCEAIHRQNRPPRRCPLMDAMETLEPQTIEINEPNLGGSFICSTSPILDEQGNLRGYTHSLKDITEWKRLEAQFHQAQRLEAVGTLAGGIAHDFNNLLMGIQGNVSLMCLGVDPTHPHYERLKSIERQIQSGAKLTSHLLGYARKGRYEVRPLDLNGLVEETLGTFERTRKDIKVHRELDQDLFAIEADPVRIEQVLFNLFVNAGDAMPGGGDLILKTMNTTHHNMKGKLYDPKHGKYVLLTVTDTGMGMDKKTQERIFDPFFTTKEMGRGTGLGLASVYGIIKSHGGYVDVTSEIGRGTTFRVYLPASRKKAVRAVKVAEQFVKGSGTVLLADDEEDVLQIGKEMLETLGYQVLTAKDGEQAVEIYRRNKNKIDFVLLDLVMPTLSGGEAFDRMREINADVKVLLASGYSREGEAFEIVRRGCDGFIQKPFDLKQLSSKLREICNK